MTIKILNDKIILSFYVKRGVVALFFMNLCGLNVQVNNIYEEFRKRAKDYIIEETEPDIVLEVTKDEILAELLRDPRFGEAYHEGAILFGKVCREILKHNAFFLHSAVVEYEGKGYLFTGRSGAGKSTHALLWQEVFPKSVIINADKPMIKRCHDGFYAYGTPWCGKEGINKNASVKICGAFFIEQAEGNSIKEMDKKEVLEKIFSRTNYMREPELNLLMTGLLSEFVEKVPFYLLECDISHEAVKTAYNAINSEEKNEY